MIAKGNAVRLGFSFILILVLGLRARNLTPQKMEEKVEFQSGCQLANFVKANGFYVEYSRFGEVFFHFADHPFSMEMKNNISVVEESKNSPYWKGVLWVAQLRTPIGDVCLESLPKNHRVWGEVVVAGDEDLMNRIESLFRQG